MSRQLTMYMYLGVSHVSAIVTSISLIPQLLTFTSWWYNMKSLIWLQVEEDIIKHGVLRLTEKNYVSLFLV